MLSLVIITTIIINRCPYVNHHDHHLLILIRSRRSDPPIRGRELPGGKDNDNIYDNNILPGGVLKKKDYLLIFFLPGGENQHQRWRRSA